MSSQTVPPTIRIATTEDLPIIISLAKEIWPATYHHIVGERQVAYMLGKIYSVEALLEQLASGHRFCICAISGEDVGFAAASPEGPGTYKLQKLYLLPSCQGKGAGKALLQWVINDVHSFGATALTLNVNRHNQPAIKFYERQGFNLLREENIDIGNGYWMNDYVYELFL
jgi:diamine N-acetyltransferase